MDYQDKKEKIMFILSSRQNREIMSDDTYKDLYILYLNDLNDFEINNEFDFYLNDKTNVVMQSLDHQIFK